MPSLCAARRLQVHRLHTYRTIHLLTGERSWRYRVYNTDSTKIHCLSASGEEITVQYARRPTVEGETGSEGRQRMSPAPEDDGCCEAAGCGRTAFNHSTSSNVPVTLTGACSKLNQEVMIAFSNPKLHATWADHSLQVIDEQIRPVCRVVPLPPEPHPDFLMMCVDLLKYRMSLAFVSGDVQSQLCCPRWLFLRALYMSSSPLASTCSYAQDIHLLAAVYV